METHDGAPLARAATSSTRMPLDVASVFDALDEPVSAFSLDGRYVYINAAGAALLGRTAAELIGHTYLDLYPDLATHPYHEAFTRLATGQAAVEYLEFHYAPMDRWSSQRLYVADAHVIVFWRDITEGKRAEIALVESRARASESERLFRGMIEWMPQLAWWAGPDGFIEYYNPRWYDYTGATPAAMEGWGWTSVHDPALLTAVMIRWQHSIATGEPFEMEFPLRRHDGVFRWFLTRVAPMRNDAGEIVRWIGINTDIDDHKRALELVGTTLESMSDAFFLLDRDWRIVRVNRNQEKLSSTLRANTLGRIFWEVFPETARPDSRYWIEYHRVMQQRVDAHFEAYYGSLDVWTEVDTFPSNDGGIAVFFRDISERKRGEQRHAQLLEREKEARASAESANRAKDEFLAMLGHELRNPLAPIRTALELMRLRDPTAAERERGVIERQVTHLVRLVDDLLDVSRITRGTVQLTRTRLDLAPLIAAASETTSPLYMQRRHRLSVEVPSGFTIDGDCHRLEQVFANLLSNAAKYTPPGGSIKVVATRENDMVVLRVTDDGVGIAPDLLPRVFDLFVQGRQDLDRAQGGLGLGLAIVQRLVELHDGHVRVTSQGPGKGATFSVYLPAIDGSARKAEPAASARPSFPSTPGKSVLIVDDNEDVAEMLAELLHALGYTTRIAHDGPDALSVLDGFQPHAAVLDIGLPIMDGYELAQAIRARPGLQHLHLIAVTGYGQASDRERATQAGFDDHLVKPVDIERLTALLEAATNRVSPR